MLGPTIAAALVLASLGSGDRASMESGVVAQPTEEHARLRLVAPTRGLVAGDTNYLGLLFDIDPEWHIYWDGLNDSGFAPNADWTAPPGVEVGEIIWPAPHRYVAPGDVLDHVYEERVLLLVPVEVPRGARAGSMLTFRAQTEWLVCKDVCLPGFGDVRLTLPVVEAGSDNAPTEFAGEFEAAWARVPLDGAVLDDPRVRVRLSGSSVEIDAQGARRLSYYPQNEAARIEEPIRRGVSTNGHLRLRRSPYDRGSVSRDPVVRFVIEADFGGDEPPLIVRVERPLSELGG